MPSKKSKARMNAYWERRIKAVPRLSREEELRAIANHKITHCAPPHQQQDNQRPDIRFQPMPGWR